VKFFIVTVTYICFLAGTTYSQRNTSVETIFKKVWEEKNPALPYLNNLKKVDSKHKHFSVAQYLIHQAFIEYAQTRKSLTPYSQTVAYYDSAIIFLDKCQAAIEKKDFSKEIDFYLPMVNSYGIYESDVQLKQDLFDLFDAKIFEIKSEIEKYNTLSNSFELVTAAYQNILQELNTLREKYPLKDDIIVLAEQKFTVEISPLLQALEKFEIAKQEHNQTVTKFNVSVSFPIYGIPFSTYSAKAQNVDEFMNSGEYTIVEEWIEQLQQGRIEKLGDFWVSFSQFYDSLNVQLLQLQQKRFVKSPIKISNEVFNKIKFIDSESAVIPYLNYLEQKQLFLFQLQNKKANSDVELIKLYGILQQCKLSLDILHYRLNMESVSMSKDALFYEKLKLNESSLKVFEASESDFLQIEENKISTNLKESLVSDFLAGRFDPGFTNYGNILIPLYEQKAGFLKEGQAITTHVLRISENKLLIGGTINSSQRQPFVALVENKKIKWLTKGIFPENALSFAGNYDYFHCSALFNTENGWGGVYYPGTFSEKNANNTQSGLLVLFDKNGNKNKILPLPVMQRIDAVRFNQVTGEYILFAENDYLEVPYQESEILSLESNGKVKWRKTLPIKSFSSLLELKQDNIFLFTNCIDQAPGESHFISSISVFEINTEGVIMKEKKLATKGSSYTTQVMQDESSHWLIFGFNGNNDLYNLRDKDIFFYMLDHTFDNIGGGELTSVENP